MMNHVTGYQAGYPPVNATPLKGRYLRRSMKSRAQAAFIAADWYRGARPLDEPTLALAAAATGCQTNDVWHALHRLEFREEILAGDLPLVPKRSRKLILPNVNGDDHAVVPFSNGDFDKLVNLAKQVDPNVWQAAGAAAGLTAEHEQPATGSHATLLTTRY